MSDTTYSTGQINLLLAAGIDLNEFFAAETGTAPAAPAKTAKDFDLKAHTAAKVHNHDRRIARRDANPDNAAGLKRELRREMAAILRAELGREFTQAEWDANAAAYKRGEFTIEGWELTV